MTDIEQYKEQVRAHLQNALDIMKHAKTKGVIIEFSISGTEVTSIEAYKKV